MKKHLIIALGLCMAFVSCDREPKNPPTLLSATFELIPPTDFDEAAEAIYDVTITNYDTREEETKQSEDNKVTFSGLVPGRYTITAMAEVSDGQFGYICSGSLSNVNILDDNKNYEIQIEVAKNGSLVFKELYYSGCKTPSAGNYWRDQFYEIYNNSEVTVYADGLCLGHVYPEQATGKASYTWDANYPIDEYLFFHTLMQIPGTPGETRNYPVQPGESIVLCQWAVNHQRETLNPNSPVDLSSGDFEYINPTTAAMTDEPAVNLNLVYRPNDSNYPQWLLSVNGVSYLIFYPEKPVVKTDEILNDAQITRAYPVKTSLIVDAVEVITNSTQVANKRIPTTLDAGTIWTEGADGSTGVYSGKGIARKVRETKDDGRIILQDTNNSTNDFEIVDPQIRRHGTKIPSWNTWANR